MWPALYPVFPSALSPLSAIQIPSSVSAPGYGLSRVQDLPSSATEKHCQLVTAIYFKAKLALVMTNWFLDCLRSQKLLSHPQTLRLCGISTQLLWNQFSDSSEHELLYIIRFLNLFSTKVFKPEGKSTEDLQICPLAKLHDKILSMNSLRESNLESFSWQ